MLHLSDICQRHSCNVQITFLRSAVIPVDCCYCLSWTSYGVLVLDCQFNMGQHMKLCLVYYLMKTASDFKSHSVIQLTNRFSVVDLLISYSVEYDLWKMRVQTTDVFLKWHNVRNPCKCSHLLNNITTTELTAAVINCWAKSREDVNFVSFSIHWHHSELLLRHKFSFHRGYIISLISIQLRHLTHCHLLKRDDAPRRIPCDFPLTIKHILLQCADFQRVRAKYFNADSLSQPFNNVSAKSILDFVKEIKLYNKF